MEFPAKAIFAFNANIDHLRAAEGSDVEKIDRAFPKIASQISESFAWGMQREMQINAHECEFFLTNFKYETIVGGQAGNAAEQASTLGVECYLHTNFANEKLFSLFSHPEKIMVAGPRGFMPAGSSQSAAASAHHFVFENKENRTRFIASYDPFPIHPDDSFGSELEKILPGVPKAFVSGLHLVKTPERARKFVQEIKKWKEINPKIQVFFEMGEFQSREALKAVQDELFPMVDMVGMNENELGSLGAELEELAEKANSVLFHTAEESRVLPVGKTNAAALEFARRCAGFFAEYGRRATPQDLVGYESKFIDSPVRTVGLGDTLSCAYFMACANI